VAGCFDFGVEWHSPLVVEPAMCAQPSLLGPVDDGVGTDPQAFRDLGGRERAVGEELGGRDVVVDAKVGDLGATERATRSGFVAARASMVATNASVASAPWLRLTPVRPSPSGSPPVAGSNISDRPSLSPRGPRRSLDGLPVECSLRNRDRS
jgi:hypothetical protein